MNVSGKRRQRLGARRAGHPPDRLAGLAQPVPVLLRILEEDPTTGRQVFEIGSGTFPIVISLEVIEHCFSIKAYLETLFSHIEPDGLGIVSTPFHGYWKNLALSLADKWDSHHDPLWKAATSSSSRRRR